MAATIVSMAAGALFGVGLEKAKIVYPEALIHQMDMQVMAMMKAFLAATVTSLIAFVVMHKSGLMNRIIRPTTPFGFGWLRGMDGNIAGGLILGFGMTLAGSCPGSAIAQIGAGIHYGWWVVAGGVVGGYLHAVLRGVIKTKVPKHGVGETAALDQKLSMSYPMLASIIAACVALGLVLLEQAMPWKENIAHLLPNPVNADLAWYDMRQVAWPPAAGGVLMGLMQVPTVLATGLALGVSSAYVTIGLFIAQSIDKVFGMRLLTRYASEEPRWTQVVFCVGLALGSLLSITLSGASYANVEPVPVLSAFLGGVCLIFGSRLGGGCTSGHGLSGVAQLSLSSLVSTACMFAGAMGLKFVMG